MLLTLVYLAILALMIYSLWKLYEMAGKPGWAAIVPIYNIIVMLEIVKKPIWWLLMMMFVPIANIVFMIMLYIEFAKAFGKGTGFAIGMMFLPFVFFPLLAFSKDTKYTELPDPVETK